jgi:hypothetical protein
MGRPDRVIGGRVGDGLADGSGPRVVAGAAQAAAATTIATAAIPAIE